MNLDEEIEDSLRICEEIQRFMGKEGMVLQQEAPELDLSDIKIEKKEPVNPKPPVRMEPADPKPPVRMEPADPKPPVRMEPVRPTQKAEPVKTPPVRKPVVTLSEDVPLDKIPVEALKSNVPKKEEEAAKALAEDISVGKNEEGEEYREKHPLLRVLLNVGICIVAALLLSFVISKFVAHHTSVEGNSMEATLNNGDQLVVEKVSYYFHDPKRFDIVVFNYDHGISFIKRVIGLPGETVQIKDGEVYINGVLLHEELDVAIMEDPGLAAEEIHLGEDEYFVLGDNRNHSNDSRKGEIGMVKKSQIQGRAWLRFFPVGDFGKLH